MVAAKVRECLQSEPWFRGVCINDFPTDLEIERDGFKSAVETVIMNTQYWDMPGLFD